MAVHDYIKSGDFATEKHVPVIETVDTVKAGETFHVTLSVGKDIAHPNTVEHHIDEAIQLLLIKRMILKNQWESMIGSR